MITLRLAGGPFGTDDERRRILRLEKSITKAVRRAGVGSVDGHGFGDGTAELFLYGPDAEMLFAAVEQLVSDFRPSAGSRALLTFGAEEGAGSRSIALGTDHPPSGP